MAEKTAPAKTVEIAVDLSLAVDAKKLDEKPKETKPSTDEAVAELMEIGSTQESKKHALDEDAAEPSGKKLKVGADEKAGTTAEATPPVEKANDSGLEKDDEGIADFDENADEGCQARVENTDADENKASDANKLDDSSNE